MCVVCRCVWDSVHFFYADFKNSAKWESRPSHPDTTSPPKRMLEEEEHDHPTQTLYHLHVQERAEPRLVSQTIAKQETAGQSVSGDGRPQFVVATATVTKPFLRAVEQVVPVCRRDRGGGLRL